MQPRAFICSESMRALALAPRHRVLLRLPDAAMQRPSMLRSASMSDPSSVLDYLSQGLDSAASLLSLTDRIAGRIGRGGPRWHRWRSLRLRLRAVHAEARGAAPAKVAALRASAAIHLAHALTAERREGAKIDVAVYAPISDLLNGVEPFMRTA